MSYQDFDPTRRRLIGAAAATLLLSVSKVGFAQSPHIIAVRIWPSETYTRVTIESNTHLQYKSFVMSNPDRLVVDLEGLSLSPLLSNIGAHVHAHDPFIHKARAGQFTPHTVRLVFDLKIPIKPQTFTLKPVAAFKNRLVIDLYPAIDKDDPLLALLQDYNQGKMPEQPIQTAPAKGKAGIDRPIVIVLDPGHGGEDPGATGPNGHREKDVVLKIAHLLRKRIQQNPKMRVHLTRTDDVFIPLGVRVATARKLNADLFISIHADAFTTPAARGSSVFALSERGATSSAAKFLAKTQNDADLIGGVKIGTKDRYLAHTLLDLTQTATINDSLRLGKFMLGQINQINRLHKDRVEQAGFAVLKAPDIPSILIETAFISNPGEEKKLTSGHFQKEMADAIYDGIEKYFSSGAILARNH